MVLQRLHWETDPTGLFPLCRFRWTKNGMEFEPSLDPRLVKEENSGTFVIPNNGNLTEYQGTYRCYASNRLGTAISQEIDFIVPSESHTSCVCVCVTMSVLRFFESDSGPKVGSDDWTISL